MNKNQNLKKVNKPWGEEMWVADGLTTPYALKRIIFLTGHRSSLHVHQRKIETNLVIEGKGIFQISNNIFDTKKFLELNQPMYMVDQIMEQLIDIEITAGDTITVQPGYVHRVISVDKLVFAECSSCELDDVVRLHDDTNRGNGKIISEHHD